MNLAWLKNYNLLLFDKIDSTNSEALRLACASVKGNFIILTNEQTAGRGQRGKEWQSLPGNLHFSILIDNGDDRKRAPQISFIAANAMYDTVAFFAKIKEVSLEVTLKWPNDVLINGKKFAGILLESINIANVNYVAVGVGANLASYPDDIEYEVTSLKSEKIILTESDNFLNIFMNRFDALLTQWRIDNNFERTRLDWMQNAHNLDKIITIDDGVDRVSGVFKEIDFDGSIRLELPGGQFRNFVSGEVTHHG